MAEKILNTRMQQKHDTEANWNKATNFKPLLGEIIVYDRDSTHSYERQKIGDGVTTVKNLPFINNNTKWDAHIDTSRWSRIAKITSPGVIGSSFICSVRGTRNSVVYNVVLLCEVNHAGSNTGTINVLSKSNYSGLKVRLVSNSSSSEAYIEILDDHVDPNSNQLIKCEIIPINTEIVVEPYLTVHGGSIPEGYSQCEMQINHNRGMQINGNVDANNFVGDLTGNASSADSAELAKSISIAALQENKSCPLVFNKENKLYNDTDLKYNSYTNDLIVPHLSSAGHSSSWIQGRNNAIIKMNQLNGYSAVMSVKTTAGSWEIGAYSSSSYTDKLIFVRCSDDNYADGINETRAKITFDADGGITADALHGVADDSKKLNGQEASYYLNYNNLSNKPTIPTIPTNYVTTNTIQTITGQKTFTEKLLIQGTATSQHFQTRNIVGSDGTTGISELYIQYGNNTDDTIHLGKAGGGLITDNGTEYSGNAATTTKWKTPRSLTLSGDVTGSTTGIDGSGNISITTTVANNSHTHSASNITAGQLAVTRGGTGASTAAGARTNLELGTIATHNTDEFVTDATLKATYYTSKETDEKFALTGHNHDGRYYTESEINNKFQNDLYESNLKWGGKHFTANFGPLDASLIGELGANRLAYGSPTGVEVEYTRDNGATWHVYDTTNSQKIQLYSPTDAYGYYYIGGETAKGTNKSNYGVRFTFSATPFRLYTVLNKFCIYLTTNGSQSCVCTIQGQKTKDVTANPSTWTVFADSIPVAGWSGYNIINTPSFTFGGNPDQYQKLQFVFMSPSHTNFDKYNGLCIYKLYGYGGVGWSTPSQTARNGTLFTINSDQVPTFPNSIVTKGHVLPNTKDSYNIGSTSLAWNNGYINKVSSQSINAKRIIVSGPTTLDMSYTSKNPRIDFSENGSQPVSIIYTDYDSYRSPAGLKIIGGTSASPAWLEVEGTIFLQGLNFPKSGDYSAKINSDACTLWFKTDTKQIKVSNTVDANPNTYTFPGKNGTIALTEDIPTDFPNKTGTGASGTWGISITGNAATSTTATTAGNVTGTVAIGHGGTGATTASGAISNLIQNCTDGTNPGDSELLVATNGQGSAWKYTFKELWDNNIKSKVTGLGYVTTDTKYSNGTGLNLSGTTFSVKYGTAAGTACQGNDSRLSNSRPANGGNADTVDNVHLEWSGSQAASDTTWLAGWTSDGKKIKAVSQSNLSVNYATSAGSATSAGTATKATTADKTDAVTDIGDPHKTAKIQFDASGPDLTATSWFAAFDGSTIKKLPVANAKTTLGLGSAAYKDESYFALSTDIKKELPVPTQADIGKIVGVSADKKYFLRAETDYVSSAGYAGYVTDKTNKTAIYFEYSGNGKTNPDYYACWDGYRLTYITKASVKTALGVPTTYAGSSSAGGAANSTKGTLTFAGAVTGTFNGSTDKTITIPTIAGPRGYSITTVKRTSGNGAAGTTDTYSIYTDASSTSPIGQFDVYNGKDGGGGSSKTLYHHMVHIDGPDSNLGSSANITFECYSYQSHINSSSTISSLAFPIMCKGTFDEGPAVDRIDRKNNKYVFEKYQGGNFSQVGTFDNWEFAYATVTDTVYAVV